MRTTIAFTCAALLALTGAAHAQQSLFSQAPAEPSATVAPQPAAAEAPKRKPKPKGPQPARALTIVNGSSAAITGVEITAGARTVRWQKPLAAEAKAVVRLPKLKGCTISVVATFEGEGAGNPGEVNICKDKIIRLTD